VIGILGAIIGGWLAGEMNISIGFGLIGRVIIAFAGAVILLLPFRLVFGRRKKSK
jgi:uncharacterized membrane protein YeaQ/YmgE (transglycosylase-associated protein family)